MRKLFFFILVIFTFNFLLVPEVLAQEYKVKPALLLPSDYSKEISESQLQKYKANFLEALKESQQFYRVKVNGKTFNLVEDVKIVKSPSSIPEELKVFLYRTKDGLFMAYDELLNGTELVPDEDDDPTKTIYIVGMIGLLEGYPAADENIALIPREVLDDLELTGHHFRDLSLSIITHELGHTFGLANAGWSLDHTCSMLRAEECLGRKTVACTNQNVGECVENIPRPLPSEEEGLRAVMSGLPIMAYLFPQQNFPNTIHNQEIQKLYQSPFINPQRDSPPPLENSSVDLTGKITVDHKVVNSGEDLILTGEGFGETPMEVNFFHVYNSLTTPYLLPKSQYEIKSWSNNRIVIHIIRGEKHDAYFEIKISGLTKEFSTKEDDVLIKGHGQPTVFSINFKTTCGEEETPFSGRVSLIRKFNSESVNVLTANSYKNDGGRGYLTYTEPDFWEPESTGFELNPQPVAQSQPIEENIKLQFDYVYGQILYETTVTIKYDKCSQEPALISNSNNLICLSSEYTFGGCNENICGQEYWVCKRGESIIDSQSIPNERGDCNLLNGPNPSCQEGSVGASNARGGFSGTVETDDGDKIPFYELLQGGDEEGGIEKAREEAKARVAEMQIFGGALSEVSAKVTDPKLKQLIDLSNKQLTEGATSVQACVQ